MRGLQRRPRAARLRRPAPVPEVAADELRLGGGGSVGQGGGGGGGGVGGRHEAVEAEHGAEGLEVASPERGGGGGGLGFGVGVHQRGRRLRRGLVEQRQQPRQQRAHARRRVEPAQQRRRADPHSVGQLPHLPPPRHCAAATTRARRRCARQHGRQRPGRGRARGGGRGLGWSAVSRHLGVGLQAEGGEQLRGQAVERIERAVCEVA